MAQASRLAFALAPQVLIDDARPGQESLRRYREPVGVIAAWAPEEVSGALARLEEAVRCGRHAAGYFSYELGYVLEARLASLLPETREVPLLWFGIFESVETLSGAAARAALQSDMTGRSYAGPLTHEWNQEQYTIRYGRVHDYIEAGDIYQANLSFRSRFAFRGDGLALYLALREQSAAAHGAFLVDGARQVLSLSPELFFDLSADGSLTAKPMKGTAPRGGDDLSDDVARRALAASAKDRAENLMIVDLLRNDLGRIAQVGSVGVKNLFAVETYPTLHTMTSTVTAKAKPRTSVAAIVSALFPCGSVTGAPKIRAMEIIRELEASPRGVYCGAIGYFSPDGSARFNVAIRTLTLQGETGELGIGGGIVQDSRADGEYAECLLKARYFEGARRPLELIETLRWSPQDGFSRLDLHLGRMAASAQAFAMTFDGNKAMDALDGAVGSAHPLRVRLTLNEAGVFACTAVALGPAQTQWRYAVSSLRVSSGDELNHHKVSWRDLFDTEQTRLSRLNGCDEVIFLNEREELAEGARSNIFLQFGDGLVTPPLSAGILNGCLRQALIAEGRCLERVLTLADLARADDVYLGNSLRGLIRATSVMTARAVAD